MSILLILHFFLFLTAVASCRLLLLPEIADKINNIVDNDKITIDEAIKRIDNLENKVKFKAFGKTTHTKKSFDKVSKVKYMDNIDLLEVQAKNIEKEVNKESFKIIAS